MCSCSSCKFTDSFRDRGFAKWPRGAPSGARKAKAEYAAHVAYSSNGARKAKDFGPIGAGFYGVPVGSSAAEVAGVLKRSFAGVPS